MANNSARPEIRAHMKQIALSVPIEAGGDLISELFIRRPTARVLEEFESLQADNDLSASASYRIVSMATGLKVEEVKEIDFVDFEQILSEVTGFFELLAPASPVPDDGAAS